MADVVMRKIGRLIGWLTASVMAGGTTLAALAALSAAARLPTWSPLARLLIALAVLIAAIAPWWALAFDLILRRGLVTETSRIRRRA